ncbi:MAG: FGGY family carbohydrate kinase, partial [Myxococcales bacterium]|nr:FGGY family carbohydrate kinase [Myxococcales bacterium]
MPGFLLSIDQGTTGSTALILSPDGRILARATNEFPQHFPRPGWVEHDLDEIWKSVGDSIVQALRQAGVESSDCAGIGITNQRETTVLWERESGRAVHRAIVWQDRRTADRCRELKNAGKETLFRERTGLVLDPYLSGTKLEWLLQNVDGLKERAEAGKLAFGTIDS